MSCQPRASVQVCGDVGVAAVDGAGVVPGGDVGVGVPEREAAGQQVAR
ncbi:MAG: hypothetical protein ACRC0L_03985 [Angustibacter sp.]